MELSAKLLFGYSGNATASFSGANVTGSAKIVTQQLDAKIVLLPQYKITPLLTVGYLKRDGNTDFSGDRNGSAVLGSAVITYEHASYGAGIRVVPVENLQIDLQGGQYDWRLNSDATGTIGALGATTAIRTNNTDNFYTFGLHYIWGDWHLRGQYLLYKMNSDNAINSRSMTASLSYAF